MHKLELKVGQQHALTLQGRGSTGYAWNWDSEGDQDVVTVSRHAKDIEPKPAEGGPPPPSFNVDEVITITAQTQGRVTLVFSLRREWEPDNAPIEQMIFDISVSD